MVVICEGGARINGIYRIVATERSFSDIMELNPAQAGIFCVLSELVTRDNFHTASFCVAVI